MEYLQPFTSSRGKFWDPEFPEDVRAGTYWKFMGRPRVDIDGFESRPGNWGANSVVGRLEDGREFRLLRGSSTTPGSISPNHADEIQTFRFAGEAALVGSGVSDVSKELAFSSARCGMPILATLPESFGEMFQIGKNVILESVHNSVDVYFSRQNCEIMAMPLKPIALSVGLEAFDQILLLAQKLLACLSGINAGSNLYHLDTTDGRRIEWVYSSWSEPQTLPISTGSLRFFHDLANVETLINDYQHTHRKYWPVADILHSTLPPLSGYAEHKFMTLAAALETIHRVRHGEPVPAKRWTRSQLEAIQSVRDDLDAICRKIGDEAIVASLRKALKNQKIGTVNYLEKVRRSFTELEAEIQGALRYDVDVWASSVKVHRDETAHIGTTTTVSSPFKAQEHHYGELNDSLRVLIRLILLEDMGLDANARWTIAIQGSSALMMRKAHFMRADR